MIIMIKPTNRYIIIITMYYMMVVWSYIKFTETAAQHVAAHYAAGPLYAYYYY